MQSKIRSQPYFLTTQTSNPSYPLCLNNIFPNSQMITLPHSGHAYLVETDNNFYQILLSTNFI